MKGYSTRDVAELLGLPPHRIRSYARAGLLDARKEAGEYRFSFQDLVVLRTARGLERARVPSARIERALRRLKSELPRGRALTELRITAEGDRIVVRDSHGPWSPESGQMQLDFTVEDLADEVAPLVRAFPGATPSVAEDYEADEWYDLALDLEAHDAEQAITAYGRALDCDPNHVDAHVNLGRLLHERGRLKQAESHYRRAVELAPTHATAWFNLGVVLQDWKRLSDAVSAYERAIALDATLADAHYNLAELYELQGDKAAALRHLQRYRALAVEAKEGH